MHSFVCLKHEHKTCCYSLTSDITLTVIIFLVMICKLEKITDLGGFQCVREIILKFSNYCVYCMYVTQSGGGRLVSVRQDRCSGFVLMAS